ncbi:capsule assembly Wzi family protein [Larkinella insperata]|uniref:Capsule assembly Wzi family protein n=1 Tax=Larkinella insperata TaxID=332158 RepID=A0ABW3QLX1_9BACT|nr:capsule assembly Wzi family protein [Larkinella insperata]
MPFWFRVNQFGVVPFNAPVGIIRLASAGTIHKDTVCESWLIKYGIELAGNVGAVNRAIFPEAFIKVDKAHWELVVGRRRRIFGLADSTLSSGSYSWSSNALPISKIEFGTQDFVPIHFTKGLIAINAFFAHGWFTNTDSIKRSFLHQKALYGRIGKPNWKVKFYGGILHNVQWGGRSRYLGAGSSVNGQLPSSFRDFLHVIISKQPSQTSQVSFHDRVNQFGNHVGSLDIGAEIKSKPLTVLLYHQHPFEDKSGIALMNLPDGLYGIQFKRRSITSKYAFKINKLLIEYLTTMNQSGHTMETKYAQYQGIDDYFNNFQYKDGWTHSGSILGTPFISRQQEVESIWQNRPGKYRLTVVNNRVKVFYLGMEGELGSNLSFQTRLSLSQNYGTYRNPFGRSVNQFSGVASLLWNTNWLRGTELISSVSLDNGNLYKNSLGVWISFKKHLDL